MKILQRYVLWEFLRGFAMSLLVMAMIMIVVNAIMLLHRHGLELHHVAKILPFMLPYSMTYLIPLSVLCGCAVCFGRLTHDRELDALRTAGIPARTVVWPVLVVIFLLSAGCLWINDRVVPYCHRQKTVFLRHGLRDLVVLQLSLGQHNISFDKYHINIQRISDNNFLGVTFTQVDDQGRPQLVVSARECVFTYDPELGEIGLKFLETSLTRLSYDRDETRVQKGVAQEYFQSMNISGRGEIEKRMSSYTLHELRLFRRELDYRIPLLVKAPAELQQALQEQSGALSAAQHPDDKDVLQRNIGHLRDEISFHEETAAAQADLVRLQALRTKPSRTEPEQREMEILEVTLHAFEKKQTERSYLEKNLQEQRRKTDAEIHLRFASGLAPLVFALVAIPFGIALRRMNRIVAFSLTALPIFTVYYPLTIAGEALAARGQLPPAAAVWVASAVFALAGLILMTRLERT